MTENERWARMTAGRRWAEVAANAPPETRAARRAGFSLERSVEHERAQLAS